MPYRGTLLDRIDDAGQHRALTMYDNEEQVLADLEQHLRQMLNVRQGTLPHLPTYGLPDLAECLAQSADGRQAMVHAIQAAIATYEPRLRQVHVTPLPQEGDMLRWRFAVTAQLHPDLRLAGDKPAFHAAVSVAFHREVDVRRRQTHDQV